ncbi:MAG TPA: group 1 truncated hemoglobin [Kofleriaceae bacterium]|nr:group 1 truncated hemoglobin [Kofleriaceae bacterium]
MTIRMTLLSLALATIAACGGGNKGGDTGPGKEASASLYDRLGKKDAITAVVKDFVEERVAKDARIKSFFANTDIPDLESKLVDQICEASGGPCKYTGKDMKTAHTGMAIKDADFNAMVEDLKMSLDHFKVGEKEQKDLLGALGAMHDDIVGK